VEAEGGEGQEGMRSGPTSQSGDDDPADFVSASTAKRVPSSLSYPKMAKLAASFYLLVTKHILVPKANTTQLSVLIVWSRTAFAIP
jgi:hypothetical protein